jgi:hypothetical protein
MEQNNQDNIPPEATKLRFNRNFIDELRLEADNMIFDMKNPTKRLYSQSNPTSGSQKRKRAFIIKVAQLLCYGPASSVRPEAEEQVRILKELLYFFSAITDGLRLQLNEVPDIEKAQKE